MRWATVDFRSEEGAGNLAGGQTSQQAQGKRHTGLGRKDWMTGREDEAQKVVANVVILDSVEVRLGQRLLDSKLRPSCSTLRSSVLFRRSRSMARCLAVAMSQAPGLSGMPAWGHCSRAMTRASWARSSANPTSRTMRARPAISLADSIRQTASDSAMGLR